MDARPIPVLSPVVAALAAGLSLGAATRTASAQQLERHHDGPASSFAQSGFSVTGLKDQNGDGMDEYAVGAPYGAGNDGIVVLYDGATGATIATLGGLYPDSLFGFAVADAGDFDGDGFHDLAVGAPGSRGYPDLAGGQCFVFSGNASSKDFLSVILSWEGYGSDRLGYSIAGVGDMDGDGLADVAVGVPGHQSDTGLVAVFGWDPLFGTGDPIWFLYGTQAGAQFGHSVGAAGNIVTNDGYADLIVGEPFFDKVVGRVTYQDIGRAHVLAGQDGGASQDPATLWIFEGDSEADYFGWSVDGIGHSTGDPASDDVIVGAPFNDVNGGDSGFVRAFSGLDGSTLFTIRGDDAHDWFGLVVRGLGVDLGGDGYDDFAVGAPGGGPTDPDGEAGIVRVFTGNGILRHQYANPATDCGPFHYFGWSIGSPDMNGDTQPDLIVGMPGDWWGCDMRGSAWIYGVFSSKVIDYGDGWAGTLGVPPLTCPDPADIGGRTSVFLGNSLGARTPGFLFVGLESADIPTNKGGHLLVGELLFTLPLSVDAAGLTLDGDIPDDPALGGLSIFLQAIELDPGASKGISFTAGLELVLGWDY